MKTLVLTMVILMITFLSYAPIDPFKQKQVERIEATARQSEEQAYFDYNLIELKDNSRRARKEVFELVQPIIDIHLERHDWKIIFPNMEDSISHALACIFLSESSNAKGHPARSSLWLLHNNPFGLTAPKGVTKKSWELINHKRVVMDVTFKTFNSFEDAIDSLIWDYLMRDRYSLARNSGSVKSFFYNLYKCGYMTNYKWPLFAYNELYLKSIAYEQKM